MAKFHEEADLDFENFSLTIARIQLLHNQNRQEIERYDEQKLDIMAKAEKARTEMATLREQLVEAQQEKANKLTYDTIADDIINSRALKPREEQMGNLARLQQEIEELETERATYGQVWQARRAQFGEIVAQLEKMQEQIKEDKEEHGEFFLLSLVGDCTLTPFTDRREGMDEEEGEEGEEIEHLSVPGGGRFPSDAPTPVSLSVVQTPSRPSNLGIKDEEADRMDTS